MDFFNAIIAKDTRQWRKMYKKSDIVTKHNLRLAFGTNRANFTEKNVERIVERGATELIINPPDLEPYPDFVFLAKKYDCKAGYDMECAIWATKGFQCN